MKETKKKKNKLGRFTAVWLGTFTMLSQVIESPVGYESTRRWTVCCHKGL